jgi:RNA polymerase sigma-70 factor (ECF subfamily)
MARFYKQAARRHGVPLDPAAAVAGASGERADPLAALAQAIAQGDGDADAAGTLIAHVGGSMLNVVRRVLGSDSADVDDVAQEAVIALLGSLATFRGECTVLHFSHRIALLTALAARRRLSLRSSRTEPIEAEHAAAGDRACSPLATALAGRRRALVRKLLDQLPDVISEALALHFMLGYTVEEIAVAASVSPNTVWSRLRLGKQALRRMLEGEAAAGLGDLLGAEE